MSPSTRRQDLLIQNDNNNNNLWTAAVHSFLYQLFNDTRDRICKSNRNIGIERVDEQHTLRSRRHRHHHLKVNPMLHLSCKEHTTTHEGHTRSA